MPTQDALREAEGFWYKEYQKLQRECLERAYVYSTRTLIWELDFLRKSCLAIQARGKLVCYFHSKSSLVVNWERYNYFVFKESACHIGGCYITSVSMS